MADKIKCNKDIPLMDIIDKIMIVDPRGGETIIVDKVIVKMNENNQYDRKIFFKLAE